jgi:hypothetical protein
LSSYFHILKVFLELVKTGFYCQPDFVHMRAHVKIVMLNSVYDLYIE